MGAHHFAAISSQSRALSNWKLLAMEGEWEDFLNVFFSEFDKSSTPICFSPKIFVFGFYTHLLAIFVTSIFLCRFTFSHIFYLFDYSISFLYEIYNYFNIFNINNT